MHREKKSIEYVWIIKIANSFLLSKIILSILFEVWKKKTVFLLHLKSENSNLAVQQLFYAENIENGNVTQSK